MRPEVQDAVKPLLFGDPKNNFFSNASSVHWAGQRARALLEDARSSVATLLHRRAHDVIFTSGGSEADNLALLGVLRHQTAQHRHLIISAVEHPAVMQAAQKLRSEGVTVTEVGVDAQGLLDLGALEDALAKPTDLVSVMAVNNETGVISPTDAVIHMAKEKGVPVHVDAVQAAGRIALPLDADLVTLSGHKLGALQGIGALIKSVGVPICPLIVGGPQERGHRAGTEPVALAVSFAHALAKSLDDQKTESIRLRHLQLKMERFFSTLEDVTPLGSKAPRVTNTSTILFGQVDTDAMLQALDLEGFAASSGSACSSGSLEASHVLLAMGIGKQLALSAVRFSLGWATTENDVDTLLDALPTILKNVRRHSTP